MYQLRVHHNNDKHNVIYLLVVPELVIYLIMWLRPKGLMVYFCVKMYAESKNQSLSKIRWYTKWVFALD